MHFILQRKTNKNYKKYENQYIEEYCYRADYAQRDCLKKASYKGRNLKIGKDYELHNYLEEKIQKKKYSPASALALIKKENKTFKTHISVPTLYRYIYSGIFLHLHSKDLIYGRYKLKKAPKRVIYYKNPFAKRIDERKDEINNRSEFGHWEMDLVMSKKGKTSSILTLIERKTRFAFYAKVKNKSQKEIAKALNFIVKKANKLGKNLFKSVTADNGVEFADDASICRILNCEDVYYAHPFCSFERGSNENNHRILRRFFPKGTDFSSVSKKQLEKVEHFINHYPRKLFHFLSAYDMFYLR